MLLFLLAALFQLRVGPPMTMYSGSGAPGGTCVIWQQYTDTTGGNLYGCKPPNWFLVGGSPTPPTTVTACGGSNDSTLLASANTSGTIYTLTGTCVIDTGITITGNNIVWDCQGTASIIRKSSTSDTTHYMQVLAGSNFTFKSCYLDVGGVLAGPDGSHDYLIYNGGGAHFYNCVWRNSGTSQPNMSGLLSYQSNLDVLGGSIESTILAVGFLHDGGGAVTNVKIQDLTVSGSTEDEIFIENGAAGTVTNISNLQCSAVTSVSGSGQNGNCVVVFQRSGITIIDSPNCYNLTFSCVRINNSIGVVIKGGICDSSNENCWYSEFGAEGNQFVGNIARNSYAGFESTNIGSRVNGIPDTFSGNSVFNIRGYGFHIENAVGSGNTCTGVPVCVEMGFGGVGFGNIVDNLDVSKVTIPVVADKSLNSTPNSTVGIVAFASPNNASQTNNVQALDLPSTFNITAATNASPLVLTTSSSLPTLDNVLLLRFFYGMTQANGVLCRVASPSGSTFTCHNLDGTNVNSTTWGVYNPTPPAGSAGVGLLLYSSGTTPAFSIPSVVQQLTIP